MSFRMIDFECTECKHQFEELTETENGLAKPEKCPKCKGKALMIMEIHKRVHRKGNRYRDVSWSTWSIS